MALSKLYNQENLEIDFRNVERLSAYNNFYYAMSQEAIEIITEKKTCNSMEHMFIDTGWRRLLDIDYVAEKTNQRCQSNKGVKCAVNMCNDNTSTILKSEQGAFENNLEL